MKLEIVGSTGSMSGPRGAASCYLIQAEGTDPETGAPRTWSIALELGPGSFGQLWNHMDPKELDALVFSHLHADHMGDIISLQVFQRWNPEGCLPPVMVAGPEKTLERIRQIDGMDPENTYEVEFDIRTINKDVTLEVGPFTLTFFPGWHTVEAYGIRVEGPSAADPSKKATIFYTGDTDTVDTITQGATGVDLLLSEAGFTDEDSVRGIHMTGKRAGETAAEARPGRLVLTHIQPWTDPADVVADALQAWDGPIDVAEPGLSWEV